MVSYPTGVREFCPEVWLVAGRTAIFNLPGKRCWRTHSDSRKLNMVNYDTDSDIQLHVLTYHSKVPENLL